jgi:hypothetical protein
MEGLSSALTVLTAMITPAVLISACGTMILSTSTRLGRIVDRVRSLSDKLEELAKIEGEVELLEDRRSIIYSQLDKLTSRAHPATLVDSLLHGTRHLRRHERRHRYRRHHERAL